MFLNRIITTFTALLIAATLRGQPVDHLLLAKTYTQSDQYDLSEIELNKGLEKFRPTTFDSLAKAAYYDELTFVNILKSDLETALRYNQESERLKQDGQQGAMIPNYRHLGLIYTRMRQFPRAKHHLEAGLSLAFAGKDEISAARLQADLADWFYRLGDYERAAAFYHKALALFEKVQGQNANQASVHMALGAVYFEKGSPGRASLEYETAKDMLIGLFGDQHISLVPVLTGEGKSLMEYGDFSLAETRLEEALHITWRHFGEKHTETAKALINFAVLKLRQGQMDQAESCADKAEQLLTGHSAAFPERGLFQEQMLRLNEVQAYIALQQYMQTGTLGQLEKADAIIKEGLLLLEKNLQGFSFETDRMAFVKMHQSMYHLALVIQKAKWDLADSKTEITEAAFQTIEQNKAQVLNSLIHDVQVKTLSGIPDELVEKQQQLKDRLIRINSDRTLVTPGDTEYTSLRQELLVKENEYENLIKQLEKEYPEFYRLRYKKNQVTVNDIRSVLDSDDALLSYYLEDSVYHIFYLDQEKMAWFTFPKHAVFDAKGLSKKPQKFKGFGQTIFGKKKAPEVETIPIPTKIIDTQPVFPLDDAISFYTKAIRKYEKDLFVRSGRSLYDKLIGPVEELIRGKKNLIIIPHGDLYHVPFEALLTKAVDEGKPGKYSKLPYLIHDYSISYHHSAALYFETRKRQYESRKAFMGFAPVFNDSLRNGWVWNSRDYLRDTAYYSDYSNLRSISNPGKRQFKELKYSKDEVVTIAKLFARDDRESEVFLYSKASEDNFKTKAGSAGIIHVASHSFVDYTNPEASGLAFALAETPSPEDGILFAPETFGLKLSTDLLVLSSCESGAGQLAEGEGLLSLTRGFLFSGARNAMVSLWRVSDRTTSRFMIDFYRSKLTDDLTYQDALREAKLKAIHNEKTAAPRNWCSFILIGK